MPVETDDPSFDQIAQLLHQGHAEIGELIAALGPDGLASMWEGTDLRGNPRRIPWWATLRHVANHSTYHRGQVAAKLKRLGIDAPPTDLALWAIENTPQP